MKNVLMVINGIVKPLNVLHVLEKVVLNVLITMSALSVNKD